MCAVFTAGNPGREVQQVGEHVWVTIRKDGQAERGGRETSRQHLQGQQLLHHQQQAILFIIFIYFTLK